MSSIRNELVALDTNQFVFAVRRDPAHPFCRKLLFERIGELRIFVPREVIRELRRNLIPSELQAALAPLRRAVELLWDFGGPPEETVSHFRNLGAKKGDAIIAAHLDASEIRTLVSENRHFLNEIPNLPFRVISAESVLNDLG